MEKTTNHGQFLLRLLGKYFFSSSEGICQIHFRYFTVLLLFMGSSGCAVRYYDKNTGIEHLWGFGHLKMAVHPSDEGICAVVKSTQTFGFGLELGQEESYVLAGWNNQRYLSVADNRRVRFEWPTADFFNVRVGTNVPPAFCVTNNSERGKP